MTHDETPCSSTSTLPVLFIVDADPSSSSPLEAALLRRYGSDYRVMMASSWEGGVVALTGLAERGELVALVTADLHLPGAGPASPSRRSRPSSARLPSAGSTSGW